MCPCFLLMGDVMNDSPRGACAWGSREHTLVALQMHHLDHHAFKSFSLRLLSGMLQVVLGGVVQAWGVQPNQLSYNTIMDAYARQGNVRNVVKIYNFMQVRASPQASS